MTQLFDIPAAWLEFGDDPLLLYSLAAAALLASVSLVSGLGRMDLAVLWRPRQLLLLCGAVAAAFLLVVAAENAEPGLNGALVGVARFPLYLMALAYGPSVGLLAGVLFAAATASGPLPGWSEAILGLELLVLGWLAIYPSPRTARWAGPFDAVVAYVLTAGTAGLAFLAWRDGGAGFLAVLSEQRALLPGLLIAWALLALVGPETYRRRLPHSRIAPRSASQDDAWEPGGAEDRRPAACEPGGHRPLRRRPRPDRTLDAPTLPIDDPNA